MTVNGFVVDDGDVDYITVVMFRNLMIMHQSGRKCVIVASAIRAEQGPCELIKGCIRKIREQ